MLRPTIGLTAFALAASAAVAKKPPAIRPLGPITRVSTEPLASVWSAVALPDGRVYANDIVARRVLLFDSTLAKAHVVADSTAATSNAYGARPGSMIAFHADTVLFIDPASSSMPVLSPAGKIARVMAIPHPGTTPFITGPTFSGGFDAQGRMVYFAPPAPPPRPATVPGKQATTLIPDSAFIVRYDLTARTLDTAASFRTQKQKSTTMRDNDGRLVSVELTPDLFPVVDDWAVCPDGTIAIVRGRDYHVDWILPDGKQVSTPKMAFDWQHLDDGQKVALIDSSLAVIKARRDSLDAERARTGPPPAAAAGAVVSGRGGGGGAGAGPPPTVLDGRPDVTDIPDYKPPFVRGAVRADANGNLWIRTSIMVKGQPVYDVINRRGEVTDRVQLPPYRTIAGFGPGVVYMAVKDSAGVVHLERARVR